MLLPAMLKSQNDFETVNSLLGRLPIANLMERQLAFSATDHSPEQGIADRVKKRCFAPHVLPIDDDNAIVCGKIDCLANSAGVAGANAMVWECPVDQWLRGDLRDLSHDLLLSERSLGRGYFQRPFVERMLREHAQGRRNWHTQIWNLMMLESWHRQFVDGQKGLRLNLKSLFRDGGSQACASALSRCSDGGSGSPRPPSSR